MKYPIAGEIEWTEARKERLRALHADGSMSFSVIAAQLAQEFAMTVTKNAAIGMARRMSLKQRPFHPAKRERAEPPQRLAAPRPAVLPGWRVKNGPRPPRGGRITLFELTSNTCRWPFGDGGRSPYLFCGAPSAGKTYCAFHTGISCGRVAREAARGAAG